MSLENASPELQLAVDLIYLLECNEIRKSCSAPASPLPICLPDSNRGQRRCPFRLSLLIRRRLAAVIRRQRSFHFLHFVALLVMQIDLQLIEGDVDVVFPTQAVN